MKRPSDIILSGIVGSNAYGLATPDSDVDRKGIFVAPTNAFLGLDHPVDVWDSHEDCDETLFELRKFLLLALKVNPTVTELLWLPDYELLTPIGADLVLYRTAFLSAPYVRNAYLGYARSQFDKLAKRGDGSFSADTRKRTAKHARHIARLVHQGFELWSEGKLTVRLDRPEWFLAFGDRVADEGAVAAEALLDEFVKLFDDTPTVLPEKPERALVDRWLKGVRRELS